MNWSLHKLALTLVVVGGAQTGLWAQVSLVGQVRTRTEYRDGLGNLAPLHSRPALFTSQRTRLTFNYKGERVTVQTSVQDVRVWGQDAATISLADGNRLMVHEAWAELTLANRADSSIRFRAVQNMSLRLGRQELVYDDVRLLGNLDWLQQGRRFDAALLKTQHRGWSLDLGAGFNQNTDAFGVTGTDYTPGNAPSSALSTRNVTLAIPAGFLPTSGRGGAPLLATPVSTNGQNQQFKAFQMAYLARQFRRARLSALVFKDDFQKYRLDSLGSPAQGYVYGRRYDVPGTHARITYGAMLTANTAGPFASVQGQVFAYGQRGRDRDGLRLRQAYHYGANLTIQKGPLSVGSGYEILSGNDATKLKVGETGRFDPLYGTPHRHWGYMDYFYVGTGSPVGGLKDAFLKCKYTGTRLGAGLDLHYFALAAPTYNRMPDAPTGARLDAKLGVEYDLTATYAFNKFTTLELGYCLMQGTNTLEYTKQGTMNQKDKLGKWAYLMLNIRPSFLAAR